MKYTVLFFSITLLFIACQSTENQEDPNSNRLSEVEKIQLTENSYPDLSAQQIKQLDRRLPPEIREILDKAEEITILYGVDKGSVQLRVLHYESVPNSEAKISDANLKSRLLNGFYSDAAVNANTAAACFDPRHRVKAKYQTKIVEIDICYECNNFRGKSSLGDFAGSIDHESKSSAIIDAIIKKYGKKIR